MGRASHFIGHFASGMVLSGAFWVEDGLLMGGAKVFSKLCFFANVEKLYLFFSAAHTEAATEEV